MICNQYSFECFPETVKLVEEVKNQYKGKEHFIKLITIRLLKKPVEHYKRYQKYLINEKKELAILSQTYTQLTNNFPFERIDKIGNFVTQIKTLILDLTKDNISRAFNLPLFVKVDSFFNNIVKELSLIGPTEPINYQEFNLQKIMELGEQSLRTNGIVKYEILFAITKQKVAALEILSKLIKVFEEINLNFAKSQGFDKLLTIKSAMRKKEKSLNLNIITMDIFPFYVAFYTNRTEESLMNLLDQYLLGFLEHIVYITSGKRLLLKKETLEISFSIPNNIKSLMYQYHLIIDFVKLLPLYITFKISLNHSNTLHSNMNNRLSLIIKEFEKNGLKTNISEYQKIFLLQCEQILQLRNICKLSEKEKDQILSQLDFFGHINRRNLIRIIYDLKIISSLPWSMILRKIFSNVQSRNKFIENNTELKKYIRKRPKMPQERDPYHKKHITLIRFKKLIKQWARYKSIEN